MKPGGDIRLCSLIDCGAELGSTHWQEVVEAEQGMMTYTVGTHGSRVWIWGSHKAWYQNSGSSLKESPRMSVNIDPQGCAPGQCHWWGPQCPCTQNTVIRIFAPHAALTTAAALQGSVHCTRDLSTGLLLLPNLGWLRSLYMVTTNEQPLQMRQLRGMVPMYVLLSKVENLCSNRSPWGPSKPLLFSQLPGDMLFTGLEH